MPDEDWTCKHLIGPDECWRHIKMKACPYFDNVTRMRKECKDFKEKLVW
jgi:hypothetical protein